MNRSYPILISAFLLSLNMNTQAQLVIAHRGASAEAPENTLAAFRLAWEEGGGHLRGGEEAGKLPRARLGLPHAGGWGARP